jgi:microsomal dipeptidase-like Zn-dependent dipeptidase
MTDGRTEADHRSELVVDGHVHGAHFLPQPYRAIFRLVNRRTIPAAESFAVLRAAGVDAAIASAVGDPIVTRAWRGRPWDAVVSQLERLRAEISGAGCEQACSVADVWRTQQAGRSAVMLGLEGADAIGSDLDRIDQLHGLGVRVIVPVHLSDNQIGTTALPWQRYVGRLPVRRRSPGLTAFGRRALERMGNLGILVDVSHADRSTVLDIAAATACPIIASHTGARACQDFARFLRDDEALAIAESGGVIGLWPYRHGSMGIADAAAFEAHARHLARIVGPEHLCIGTDMNGVPGVMSGYEGERDFHRLLAILAVNGLSESDLAGIAGENLLRVMGAVIG